MFSQKFSVLITTSGSLFVKMYSNIIFLLSFILGIGSACIYIIGEKKRKNNDRATLLWKRKRGERYENKNNNTSRQSKKIDEVVKKAEEIKKMNPYAEINIEVHEAN